MNARRAGRFGGVLITGGSRGLGLELAREFGQRGARVAICARDAEEVDRAVGGLRQRGTVCTGVVVDITNRERMDAAVPSAVQWLGGIDILVNNAGVIQVGPRDEMTLDDYHRAMDAHFWGPLYAAEAVLPYLRERRQGSIVNITSIGGRISVPHLLPYSASKFALVGYSEGLRAELLPENIFVTTVVPGLMRTGSPEKAEFKGHHRLEYAWFVTLDSLPFVSVDVTEAARLIVDAAERGDAELTISVPAKLGSIVHGIFPGFVSDALSFVARLLPRPGGVGKASRRGAESHSVFAPSPLTTATQERATTQNEVRA